MSHLSPEQCGSDGEVAPLTPEDIVRSEEFRQYFDGLVTAAQEQHGKLVDFVRTNKNWHTTVHRVEESPNSLSDSAKVSVYTWMHGADGSMTYISLKQKWDTEECRGLPADGGVAEWDESRNPVPGHQAEYVEEYSLPDEPPEYDAWEEVYVMPEERTSLRAIKIALALERAGCRVCR